MASFIWLAEASKVDVFLGIFEELRHFLSLLNTDCKSVLQGMFS
jgi:hypothetical protein